MKSEWKMAMKKAPIKIKDEVTMIINSIMMKMWFNYQIKKNSQTFKYSIDTINRSSNSIIQKI